MVGETLGAYKIIGKLGEGGMGAVFVAAHTRIERYAAVKMLRPEFSYDQNMVGRFFTEARATSRIRHPGIVEVFDCDVTPMGQAYIVMDLLEGETLASLLERAGNLSNDLGAVVSIGAQIASALSAAHNKGIVHRDLKPDNVFLIIDSMRLGEPTVKIVDFGIAKLLGNGGDRSSTQTGHIIGTPLFMSPEQCRGIMQIDQRADIYALGCILMAMSTGEPPFLRVAVGDIMVAHIAEAPPLVSDRVTGIPAALDALVGECLAKDPGQRPSDMRTIEARLRDLGRSLPAPRAMPHVPPAPWRTESLDHELSRSGSTARLTSVEPRPLGRTALMATPGGTQPLPKAVVAAFGNPTNTTLGAGATAMEDKVEGRRLPLLVKIGAPVAAIVLAVAWWGKGLGANKVVPVAAAHSSSSTSVSAGVQQPSGPTSSERNVIHAENGRFIHVEIRGLPVGAVLTLDGDPVNAPIEMARDDRKHQVLVRAPGYLDEQLAIQATEDQSLSVTMRPEASPSSPNSILAPTRTTRKRSPGSHATRIKGTRPDPEFHGFDDL